MIIGYDGGYDSIKTSEGLIFPSKITTKESLLNQGTNWIEIEGTRYYIGEGESTMKLNKVNCNLTKVCLLYALSLSDDDEFNIVTGLPIGQYRMQKNEFKNMLIGNKINQVRVSQGRRNIIINEIEIFPQAAGAGYTINPNEDYIIGDIGGRTFDICYFRYINGKRKLVKYSTILEGTFSLYADAVKEINQRFETDLRIEDGKKVLNKGLKIYGEKQDISFLKSIIEMHLSNIINEIIVNYPYKTTKLYLTGGGSYLYGNAIQSRIPGTVIMENCQFNNANGFKKVGESLWQTEEG